MPCHGGAALRRADWGGGGWKDFGLPGVAQDEAAALVGGGEADDEGAEHAGCLFGAGGGGGVGVSGRTGTGTGGGVLCVWLEHGAFFVDEHLVELGCDGGGDSEFLGDEAACFVDGVLPGRKDAGHRGRGAGAGAVGRANGGGTGVPGKQHRDPGICGSPGPRQHARQI